MAAATTHRLVLGIAALVAAVALGSASSSSAAPAQATPVLTIADVTVLEGNAGITNAVFTVTSNVPAPNDLLVFNAETRNGSATAGTDYTAVLQTFRIERNQTSTTVTVPVRGDTEIEFDENFSVLLSYATCSRCIAEGIIEDDDTPPPPPEVLCRCQQMRAELASFKARRTTGSTESWDFAVKGTIRCRGGNTPDCEGFVTTASPSTLATQTPRKFTCVGGCGGSTRFALAIRVSIARGEIVAARERWRSRKTPLLKKLRVREGCRGTRGAVRTFTLAFTNGNRFSASMSDRNGDGKPDGGR